jgi:hypothetical protein
MFQSANSLNTALRLVSFNRSMSIASNNKAIKSCFKIQKAETVSGRRA